MADNDKPTTDPTLPPEPSPEPSQSLPPPQEEPASEDIAPLNPTPVAPPARSSRSSSGLLILGSICLLAIAAAGYWLWQKLEQREAAQVDLQRQLELNSAQLGDVQRQLRGELENQLEQLLTTSSEREQKLQQSLREVAQRQAELQGQLDGQQQRLNSLTTTSREDWLLAEAEYLLNLANQRVLMERSAENALALLRAADDRLQQVGEGSGDASVFAIRKTLNEEITALEKVSPVDKEGMYLRLYALAETVDDLPRLQVKEFDGVGDEMSDESAADADAGWAGRLWNELKKMAGTLDRYVRIDDVAAPAKPLVDSYAAQVAALNVRLLLEQAQLAVLQEEPTVYRHSLEKAQTLVQQYYVESQANQTLQNALKELVEIEVAPPIPDISKSRAQLRDYLRQLHRVRPAPEGQL